VCPQFETTKSAVSKCPHKTQKQDGNYSSLHAGGACRKAITRKFPPLTFENPEGYAVHPSDQLNCLRKNTEHAYSHPKKGTAAKDNIQVSSPENCREIPLLPAPQPVEPEVFSPPDVETPQMPSKRNRRGSSQAWQPEKEPVFSIDPCARRESAAVLVTDTPEHEYGVKVTWRQRPHLMKYLLERGTLSPADVLVRVDPELSRRQADI
ncbi:PREDICTED: RAD9, HUS1, RAD1-interacting nuclear orphan protein 1, partial [Apaloderma vittatum]|uniref:RAD9, HUS1, RAD1-interacting nuclear orphan protein 1 n=1 Tax=Apaloderma vittatum TaxID=57397 RepID=UPI0005219570